MLNRTISLRLGQMYAVILLIFYARWVFRDLVLSLLGLGFNLNLLVIGFNLNFILWLVNMDNG